MKNSSKHLVFSLINSFLKSSNMKKVIFILTAFFFAASCSGKVIDVKSPCVSNDDGPCGSKKSINEWWIKNSKNPQKQNS